MAENSSISFAHPGTAHQPWAAYPYLALALIQFISYGLFSWRLGFYHDDWSILELLSQGRGFFGALRVMAHVGSYWGRPMGMPVYASFYALGGFHPWIHQLLLQLLQTTEIVLLYVFLERLLEDRGLAFTASALAVLYPNRDVTHYWFTNSAQSFAQVMSLLSLILHHRWIFSRKFSQLILSQLFYLLGVLCYESCAFIPLLLAGGLLMQGRHSAREWPRFTWKIIRDMTPYACIFGLAMWWEWSGLRWMHGVNPKSSIFIFSWSHFFKAYGAGFECLTNRVLHHCALSARHALNHGTSLSFLLWGACVSGIAALVLAGDSGCASKSKETLHRALGATILGFIGSYAPYALSGSYMPQIFGIMSRTNGTGAWIGGLLLACGLDALHQSALVRNASAWGRLRTMLLIAILGAFTWNNWVVKSQYEYSWNLQNDILAKVKKKIQAIPGPMTLLLADYPAYTGVAIVFDAPWDFDAALRLFTGRKDLAGAVFSGYWKFEKSYASYLAEPQNKTRYPYTHFYVFRYWDNVLLKLDGPPKTPLSRGDMEP